jgi:hypothetical protein
MDLWIKRGEDGDLGEPFLWPMVDAVIWEDPLTKRELN